MLNVRLRHTAVNSKKQQATPGQLRLIFKQPPASVHSNNFSSPGRPI
jgi:hypothetical protein